MFAVETAFSVLKITLVERVPDGVCVDLKMIVFLCLINKRIWICREVGFDFGDFGRQAIPGWAHI